MGCFFVAVVILTRDLERCTFLLMALMVNMLFQLLSSLCHKANVDMNVIDALKPENIHKNRNTEIIPGLYSIHVQLLECCFYVNQLTTVNIRMAYALQI